jgi:hypothetical protein
MAAPVFSPFPASQVITEVVATPAYVRYRDALGRHSPAGVVTPRQAHEWVVQFRHLWVSPFCRLPA